MCAQAISLFRIRRLIFGAVRSERRRRRAWRARVRCGVVPSSTGGVGGVRESEAAALLQGFFAGAPVGRNSAANFRPTVAIGHRRPKCPPADVAATETFGPINDADRGIGCVMRGQQIGAGGAHRQHTSAGGAEDGPAHRRWCRRGTPVRPAPRLRDRGREFRCRVPVHRGSRAPPSPPRSRSHRSSADRSSSIRRRTRPAAPTAGRTSGAAPAPDIPGRRTAR